MDAYAKTHQKCYQHYPAQRMRLVRPVVPDGHEPEYQCREQTGHRVNLALDCREPERVREAVGQCAHHTADGDGRRGGLAIETVLARLDESLYEPNQCKV